MEPIEHKSPIERLEEVVLSKIEASVKDKKPINLTKDDVLILKEGLKNAEVNLDIDEQYRVKLFQKSEFRTRVKLGEGRVVESVEIYDRERPKNERWVDMQQYDFTRVKLGDDRTIGVFAMLGGRKFEGLIRECYERARDANYPGVVGENEGTRGRGFQQAMADVLMLTLLNSDSEDFQSKLQEIESRLNRKLLAGLLKTGTKDKGEVKHRFEMEGIPEPDEDIKGFPTGQLTHMIKFLATKPGP